MTEISRIENLIYFVRGHRVMLDSDWARLYQVPTKYLNEQTRRNKKRFPSDLMFSLAADEAVVLRLQIATSKKGRGSRRDLPLAFTEQGAAMLSSVLNSGRSVQVNIQIMRTFVKLRWMVSPHSKLEKKIEALERKYDGQFKAVFEALRRLLFEPKPRNDVLALP